MMSAYRIEVAAWLDWYAASVGVSRLQNSGAIGGGCVLSAAADGSYVEWQFSCAAGTYTLTCLYRRGGAHGKLQLSVDGADVGALTDCYAASADYNNVLTATGLALTEGVHTLRARSNGKNASATDHYHGEQWLSLERTGA